MTPKLDRLTPSQRLWAEVFGLLGIPELDEGKVLAIVNGLPERERLAVRLRFGFGRRPLSYQKMAPRLPRARGGIGVSREIARLEVHNALRRLRGSRLRPAWDEAGRAWPPGPAGDPP